MRRSLGRLRLIAVAVGEDSVGALLVHAVERAAPWAVKLGQQLLGGRHAARHEFLERREVAAFVAALRVELAAAGEALRRKIKREPRKIEHALPRDRRLEAELGHI